MCARKMVVTDLHKLREIFGVTHGPTPNFAPRYNLPITEREPVLRVVELWRTLELATWDYRDEKVTSLKGRAPFYNARGEAMSKSAVFAQRRCLVPCDGFYEWMTINGKKQPFVFRRQDGQPFAMGGVWSNWTDPASGETILTYVELTVAPGALVAPIHNRAPLIIDQKHWGVFLEGATDQARQLVKPSDMTEFVRYAVSPAINSVKAEGAALIEPYEYTEQQPELF